MMKTLFHLCSQQADLAQAAPRKTLQFPSPSYLASVWRLLIAATLLAISSGAGNSVLAQTAGNATAEEGTSELMQATPSPQRAASQSVMVQPNDNGEAVSTLQQRLTELGYYNGPITGFYGPMTQEAVSKFQKDQGIPQDGVVGATTRSALFSSTGQATQSADSPSTDTTDTMTATSSAPRGTLKLDDSGNQVTELQNRLTALGYYNGPISGKFDVQTEAAVMTFQQDNGLTPDGIVGSSTEAALQHPSASSPNQRSNPATTSETTSQSSANPTNQTAQTTQTAQTAQTTPQASSSASQILDPQPSRNRVLRLGDTGGDVGDLQLRLQALGFYKGLITGNYTLETESAVVAFQKSQNLTPDGIAGPQVALALQNSTPAQSPAQSPAPAPASVPTGQAPAQTGTAQQQVAATSQPTQAQLQAQLQAEQAKQVLFQNLEEGRFSVVALQRHLQLHGFTTSPINGVFDANTQKAISDAQRNYGLSEGDLFGAGNSISLN
jgi:peptidoglycan hydrolase-like protein with peptidoglycan-binding domain